MKGLSGKRLCSEKRKGNGKGSVWTGNSVLEFGCIVEGNTPGKSGFLQEIMFWKWCVSWKAMFLEGQVTGRDVLWALFESQKVMLMGRGLWL